MRKSTHWSAVLERPWTNAKLSIVGRVSLATGFLSSACYGNSNLHLQNEERTFRYFYNSSPPDTIQNNSPVTSKNSPPNCPTASTVTRLRAGWWGLDFSQEREIFSLHPRVQTGSGFHPASYPVDTGALSPGVKLPMREADHSPTSSSTKVKNVWSYTSTLQYVFMAW
jgi:hypothetical protein